MANERLDWRAQFRLHTMDLNREAAPVAGGQAHWMLQENSLRSMIATLEKDYRELSARVGNAFDGREITAEAVIAKLGYAGSEEPRGLFATVKFVAAFVAACLRENARVHSQMPPRRFQRSS